MIRHLVGAYSYLYATSMSDQIDLATSSGSGGAGHTVIDNRNIYPQPQSGMFRVD
jgi:hypothetical protein